MVVDTPLNFRVAIVYDTSYLMNDPLLISLDRSVTIKTGWFKTQHLRWSFTHFLCNDVKSELKKHHDGDEKKGPASAARKAIVRLMRLDDYQTFESRSVPLPSKIDAILGADSEVDRKLLGKCLELELSGEFDLVYLATDDGGLMIDIQSLRQNSQSQINYLTTDPNVAAPTSGHLLTSYTGYSPLVSSDREHILRQIAGDALALFFHRFPKVKKFEDPWGRWPAPTNATSC